MNKFAILLGLSFILPSKVIAVTGGGDQGGPAYESWQGLIIKDENRCSAYDKKADYGPECRRCHCCKYEWASL